MSWFSLFVIKNIHLSFKLLYLVRKENGGINGISFFSPLNYTVSFHAKDFYNNMYLFLKFDGHFVFNLWLHLLFSVLLPIYMFLCLGHFMLQDQMIGLNALGLWLSLFVCLHTKSCQSPVVNTKSRFHIWYVNFKHILMSLTLITSWIWPLTPDVTSIGSRGGIVFY